jgi:hypothetical protein
MLEADLEDRIARARPPGFSCSFSSCFHFAGKRKAAKQTDFQDVTVSFLHRHFYRGLNAYTVLLFQPYIFLSLRPSVSQKG